MSILTKKIKKTRKRMTENKISEGSPQHVVGHTYLEGRFGSGVVRIEPALGDFNSARLNFKRR
jgi:hypothetical protein